MPALLFSFWGTAAADTAGGHSAFAGSESVLTRWHDYALASITPQFSWAALPATSAPPRVLDHYGARLDMPPLFTMAGKGTTHVSLAVAKSIVGDTPGTLPDTAPSMLGVPQSGVERTVVTPSLVQQWDDGSTVRLSAVLAYQRFASLDLGMSPLQNGIVPPTWADTGNTSYGAGARVDVGGPISERLRWGAAYQSRVGMDAFPNYRGVFSDPGDFDIPANASFGVSYALTPAFGVDVGVQRVMYGAITPFTSAALPTRFLALLGDGASPVFAWRDLTVYSLGWTLHDDRVGNLEVRYTTRQQPMPTSELLAHALEPVTANDMVSLGWSRALGENSHMSFAASYASSPYLLMMPSYRSHDPSSASQVEFEALYSVRF
ncbi:MAG TPA: hypothetical protein VHE32_05190 [Rhodanobacteraceae bacterium]|nr:hypothetical protein [Rhodanobacteraceae bacterium]